MRERDAFDRILVLLHEASLDDARWPAASALIDEACRAKGNDLVFGDGRSQEDVRIFFARFCRCGQRHRELEREYFDVYHRVRGLDADGAPAGSPGDRARVRRRASRRAAARAG